VQLANNRGRRVLGQEERRPETRFEIGQALLVRGWEIGQEGGAVSGQGCEPLCGLASICAVAVEVVDTGSLIRPARRSCIAGAPPRWERA
jgi:hypothetical protein